MPNVKFEKKTFLRSSVASLSSQILGMLQIFLLLKSAGPGRETDAYFLMFTWGMLPIQILLVGVAYPSLLNTDKPSSNLNRTTFFVGLACIISLITISTTNLVKLERLQTIILCFIMIVNLVLSAYNWKISVIAWLEGDSSRMASVALIPNAVACAFLMIHNFSSLSISPVQAMTLGLTLGNLATLFWYRNWYDVLIKSKKMQIADSWHPHRADGFFLLKSLAGYGTNASLQATASLLPPSSITFFSVVSRLVGAVVTSMVNVILPRLVNSTTTSSAAVTKFIRLIQYALGPTIITLEVVSICTRSTWLSVSALAVAWLSSASANAAAQRAAMKFLNQRIAIVNLLFCFLGLFYIFIVENFKQLHVTHLFVSIILIELSSALFYLWKLKGGKLDSALLLPNLLILYYAFWPI